MPYCRELPPLPLRYVIGVAAETLKPATWILEKTSLTPRVMGMFSKQARKRIKEKNPFRGYKPTSHDVFVATYVKSGTNWMMQIAHQLAFHGNADFEHIHCVVPWPDTALSPPMRKYAIPVDDTSVWTSSPEQKRVIKTHFNWELLPYSEDARYIMVIRDPKDVFVSSYFFFVKNSPMGDMGISVDTWLKVFLSDGFPFWGSWTENTAGYWAERHRPNVLVIPFKEMKRDLKGSIGKVAALLNMNVSDDVIERVAEKSSFDYMKTIDEKFKVWNLVPWIEPGPMIRKGKQGGSSELLTIAQQRQIDEYFAGELKRLRSDFPYDEFCDVTV